jgi:integrase
MKQQHGPNERIKYRYFQYLAAAKSNGEQSIDAAAMALHRFEVYTGFKAFKAFHIKQAIGFKDYLASQKSGRTKEPLSSATIYSILAALKAFFQWLSGQRGYKSRLTPSDAEYFNASSRDTAIAKARRERAVPSVDQVRHVVNSMPCQTDIERRNRALIATAILTGARDNALASLRLGDVNLEDLSVFQDAHHVRTKFSKTQTTTFFPVGEDFRAILADWVHFLLKEKLCSLTDPLFPATKVMVGKDDRFTAVGLDRIGWSNADRIRTIFKDAFLAAGLPYYNPHSFRHTLARLAPDHCDDYEQLKSWSQNLGHDDLRTTMVSYGGIAGYRQAEVIRMMWKNRLGATQVLPGSAPASLMVQRA